MSGRRKTPGRSNRNKSSDYNNDKHSYKTKYRNNSTTKTDKSRIEKTVSTSPYFAKNKPAVKLPYFRDQQRENDRLRQLYGRSRSRSPPTTSFARRHYSPARRSNESLPRIRSMSRDKHHKYSPTRSSRRDYNRSIRSRSASRTYSPIRHNRHKYTDRSSRENVNAQEETNTAFTNITQTTPQFIPIPIVVPAAYSMPGWSAPNPTWHFTQHRPLPTSHFAPIPMLPMMDPFRPPPQSSYPVMPLPLTYATIAGPPYRLHIGQRYPPPKHNTNKYQAHARKPTS